MTRYKKYATVAKDSDRILRKHDMVLLAGTPTIEAMMRNRLVLHLDRKSNDNWVGEELAFARELSEAVDNLTTGLVYDSGVVTKSYLDDNFRSDEVILYFENHKDLEAIKLRFE